MGNSNTKKSFKKTKNGEEYGKLSLATPSESKDILSPSDSKNIMNETSPTKPYNQLSMESIISPSNIECSIAFLKPECENKQIIIKSASQNEKAIPLGVKLPAFSYLKKSSILSCIYITFDVSYLKYENSDMGRHGGVYFGSKYHTHPRFNGKWTIEKGAKVTTIDWIDRKSDRGFRIYGTNEAKLAISNHIGVEEFKNSNYCGNWKIIIDENKKGCFYFNNECLYDDFEVIYNQPCHIGFWSWQGNEMKIENLQFGYGVNYDVIKKLIDYWYIESQNGLHMQVTKPWKPDLSHIICLFTS